MKQNNYQLYLQKTSEAKVARAMEMYKLWLKGLTYERIGLIHGGISRERVRQLICVVRKPEDKRRPEIDEQALKAQINSQRAAANEEKCQILYGCSYTRFREIQSYGALPKFTAQKRNSRIRGIPWKMTLNEWWLLWEASGKWRERGPDGYVMCRKDDNGPYSPKNVRIATCSENIKEAVALARKNGKQWGTPKGSHWKQKRKQRLDPK